MANAAGRMTREVFYAMRSVWDAVGGAPWYRQVYARVRQRDEGGVQVPHALH